MKNLSLIALLLVLLASCQQADELASPNTSPAIGTRSEQTRPFEATFSGVLNPNSAPTACSGDLQPLLLLDYFISGNATHLGNLNSELSSLHHENCDLSFATALLTTAVSGQLVAANGDAIYYSGDDVINVFNLLTASGTTGTISGSWTITGGTGRFEGASGSFTINGLVDFTTFGFSVEAEGTITY
jgi:hypothetical protein